MDSIRVRNVSKHPVNLPDGTHLPCGAEANVDAKDAKKIRTLLGGTLLDVDAQPTIVVDRPAKGYVLVPVPEHMVAPLREAIEEYETQ